MGVATFNDSTGTVTSPITSSGSGKKIARASDTSGGGTSPRTSSGSGKLVSRSSDSSGFVSSPISSSGGAVLASSNYTGGAADPSGMTFSNDYVGSESLSAPTVYSSGWTGSISAGVANPAAASNDYAGTVKTAAIASTGDRTAIPTADYTGSSSHARDVVFGSGFNGSSSATAESVVINNYTGTAPSTVSGTRIGRTNDYAGSYPKSGLVTTTDFTSLPGADYTGPGNQDNYERTKIFQLAGGRAENVFEVLATLDYNSLSGADVDFNSGSDGFDMNNLHTSLV